jgi:hypothetical protein
MAHKALLLTMLLATSAAHAAPLAVPPMAATARIPGADGGWDYASVDPASHRLLVSRSDGVMTLDLATSKMKPMFVPGERVHASFVIPGTSTGVSTNGTTNTAKLFDATTGVVTATIKVGAKPDAATWDAKTGTV